MKIEFTDLETKEIKGGQILDFECRVIDIRNTNSVDGCNCNYNNKSVIENNNKVEGCHCSCLK